MALFMTPREVAARWSCSARHVRRLCASGELPAMRLGLEAWRIKLEAVEAYEAVHSTAASTAEPVTVETSVPANVVTFTPGDFELPPGYEPRFPDLWPGHVPQDTKKRPSAVTKRR